MEVTPEWLQQQGAKYHEPWWQLGRCEVFVDDGIVVAINDPDGPRVESPTREQILEMM